MPHYEPSENLLFVENVNLSQHFSVQQIHWGRFLLYQWPRSKAEAQVVQARVEGSRGRCGAHPSWRFKGKVSHQSCLKVSLIQALKRDIFISRNPLGWQDCWGWLWFLRLLGLSPDLGLPLQSRFQSLHAGSPFAGV